MTENSDLIRRLNKHARDFDLTEAEPDEPGNLVHDLQEAIFTIENQGWDNAMTRRAGNSRLIYDKKRRTIITVRRPWWRRLWGADGESIIFWCPTGPLMKYVNGSLHISDLNPAMVRHWRMSRMEMLRLGLRSIAAALRR